MKNILIILACSWFFSFIVGLSTGRYPVQTIIILILILIICYAGYMNDISLYQSLTEIKYFSNVVLFSLTIGILAGIFIGHRQRIKKKY